MFASLAPGCSVLAFAAQSSLDPAIAPFEGRYRYASKLGDWSAPFIGAALGIHSAGRAYLIHDPLVEEDRMHGARMAVPNVQLLAVRHFTHKIPPMLKRTGVLKQVALSGMSADFQPLSFRRLMRKRPEAVPYLLSMIGAAIAKGHVTLAERAAKRALELVPNWKLRQLLAQLDRTKTD